MYAEPNWSRANFYFCSSGLTPSTLLPNWTRANIFSLTTMARNPIIFSVNIEGLAIKKIAN